MGFNRCLCLDADWIVGQIDRQFHIGSGLVIRIDT